MANHVETVRSAPAPAVLPRRQAAGALPLHALWRFCRRKPLGALGGVLVLVLLVMALFAPWIAHYAYDETIRGARMKPPSTQFWMGTDNLGRDIWSRVVYGARISVTVGFGAVLIANVLAAGIGITSGYLGGKYDLCVQRVVDSWQSFPFLVVILSVMAVLGPGLFNIILALGVIGAANASRVIRGTTVSVAQNVYIEAARALGAGHLRVMARHILPNVAATIDRRDVVGAERAIRPVPLVEPVAHAEHAEDHRRGREVPKPALGDSFPDHSLDRAIVVALLLRGPPCHRGGQAALLAEEHPEERQMACQQGHLVANDAAEFLVRRKWLLHDVAESGAERLNSAVEHLAEQRLLARHVLVERDLGDAHLTSDRVEGSGAVAHLAEARRRDPDDLLLQERSPPPRSRFSHRAAPPSQALDNDLPPILQE